MDRRVVGGAARPVDGRVAGADRTRRPQNESATERTPPGTVAGSGDGAVDRPIDRQPRTGASAAGPAADGRPHLSFVVPNLTVGGAEQVTIAIANGLAARGHAVELVVGQFDGKLRSALRSAVDVVELSPTRTPVLGVAAELLPIVNYLRTAEPAALFPQLTRMNVVCLAAARVAGTDTDIYPVQHSAYGHRPHDVPKAWIGDWLVGRLYPTADRIIAVSDGVADGIARQTAVDRDDISVLHNPVDVDHVRQRAREPVDHPWIEADETPVVLSVGRLAAQKDLETWLDAFATVHRRNPAVRGVIAGQGPQRERIREAAAELGVEDVVSIPGYVDNPYRYMARADLFLMSSRYEGLPTVLIEALACGCPVVSTDCPHGPREILADGTYGRLVPVGDPGALAAAARETLADPPAADRLRGRADDFAPSVVLDDYERFIETHVGPD